MYKTQREPMELLSSLQKCTDTRSLNETLEQLDAWLGENRLGRDLHTLLPGLCTTLFGKDAQVYNLFRLNHSGLIQKTSIPALKNLLLPRGRLFQALLSLQEQPGLLYGMNIDHLPVCLLAKLFTVLRHPREESCEIWNGTSFL